MNSELLPAIIQEALDENQTWLPAVLDGKVTAAGILAFCHNFRVAGIGRFFLTHDPEPLCWHLHQSGATFAHYLTRMGQNPLPGSRGRPFLDAVSAGDFTSAERIARFARRTWAQGFEYEEDFLFIEFLMQHFFLGGAVAACHGLLNKYEKALQGADDLRLPVCRALLDSDAHAFHETLSLFLDDRSAQFEQRASRQTLSPDLLMTERYFSIEGLALLRCAERKQLSTQLDYRHVPSSARGGSERLFHPDDWRHIER